MAAADLSGFDRVSAFWASLRADWIDFSAEGTDIIVCRDEFSTIFTGVFVTWHLLVSFAPFFIVIYAFGVES